MKKQAEMKQHGEVAMGFDQDKTTHHFSLFPDGGAIAVSANNPDDGATRDQVRAHLKEIAAAFGRGDFEKPALTHGEMPPGVSTMRRLRTKISYTFEETPGGGAVRISTANGDARSAIHEFLRYQIREHGTGDPTTVQSVPRNNRQ